MPAKHERPVSADSCSILVKNVANLVDERQYVLAPFISDGTVKSYAQISLQTPAE